MVSGGYSPNLIEVREGVPPRITFGRRVPGFKHDAFDGEGGIRTLERACSPLLA